jgi:hypothetical protein
VVNWANSPFALRPSPFALRPLLPGENDNVENEVAVLSTGNLSDNLNYRPTGITYQRHREKKRFFPENNCFPMNRQRKSVLPGFF